MSNMTVIAIYVPFAVISACIFVIDLSRRFKRQEHYLIMLLSFCAVCWYISDIWGILTNSVELGKFFINFILIFVGFIPPILLLFVLKFYNVSFKLTNRTTIPLFFIPTINIVMSLTANYHTLVNKQLEIVSLSPIREVVLVWGPWFWVHTAYSYVLSMLIIGIILVQHFRIAKFYRIPSTMMVAGVAITLVGNIITLFQLLPIALDPTLIAMSLSLIFFDLAIINNNNSKFVRFSKGQIFHHLHEYILVLDENQRVVDCNQPALEWFSSRNISLTSSFFDDVMGTLLSSEKTALKRLESENESDIYLNDGVFPMTLNLRIEKITDIRREEIGSIAVFTDVTQNRMLIERLEAKAGMDSLTGLANHMAYEGAKIRLDNQEYYPLSVVMCDANNLKHVNDNFGHKYGDMLLQEIADVLDKVCPNQRFVARIGGDEFIYLLPCAPPEDAYALMTQVREMLADCKKTPFSLSVAMGTATKHSAEEDLNDIIALADSRMYENKKKTKSRMEEKKQQ